MVYHGVLDPAAPRMRICLPRLVRVLAVLGEKTRNKCGAH